MAAPELSERARRLLAALVREYIESGEAVSSQTLARESALGVSSATIRNVLAQLEEAGYVHQPHTSAGRVPTDRAYRVFVDQLLDGGNVTHFPSAEQELRQQAERSPLVDHVLATATHVVSRAARYVAFTLAETPDAVLKRMEFVPLGPSRVLVVVVTGGDQVQQKVVDLADDVSPSELTQAANYLNTEFAGMSLSEVRATVLEQLRQERVVYDRLLSRALRLASSTFEQVPRTQTFHVEGASSLLDGPRGAVDPGVPLTMLRSLLEMMEEKERLIQLLTHYIDGPGLTVVIGTEHQAPHLRPFSLIANTAVEGTTSRTVGVIGPTRMHYSRAIGVVNGTAQAVSRVLRDTH